MLVNTSSHDQDHNLERALRKHFSMNQKNMYYENVRYRKSLTLAVFFIVFVAELIAAYVLIYQNGYLMNDAMCRTANAYYVFHIKPNKLASIGLVWNPLPSLLQLPILLFSSIWPPLATHGLAGSIVTAFFAAFNAAYIMHSFRRTGLRTVWALTLTALYAFNPFIFYYGCNGMSEMPFATSMIVAVVALTRWIQERKTADLLLIASMLAMGFLCRYEAIPFAAGIGLALGLILFFLPDPRSPFKGKGFGMKLHHFIATSVVVFLPIIYTLLVWIFLNWTIMGDPLYFQHSQYANTAQASYTQSVGITNILNKTLPFSLLYMVIVMQRLFRGKLLKADFLVLTVLAGVVTAFHYVMLLSGNSFGWLRFFFFSLPICMAWLPYEFSQYKGNFKMMEFFSYGAAMMVASVMLWTYLPVPDKAPEEYNAIMQTDTSTVAMQMSAARRINDSYSDGILLLDSSKAAPLTLNLTHPENLIINTMIGFNTIVKKPWEYRVRYILVSMPEENSFPDEFARTHPGLYEHGADWCVELEDFGTYKIFEVIY
jgi:predicted anti-sigma-YlaC factor YlaD